MHTKVRHGVHMLQLEYYKNDINDLEKVDISFKRMYLLNAIKYILNKKNNNVSLLKEDECLREYNSYFQYINNFEIILSFFFFFNNTNWLFLKYLLILKV